MLAVQPCLNVFVVGINIVENSISIHLMRRSEYNYLEVLVRFFKTLHYVRPDVDARVNCLLIRKVDL